MSKSSRSVSGQPTFNQENRTKDAIYWKILSAAVTLDIQKGHQRWTITQLSRKTKVSRTLIYYYFGSSKIELLKEAISTIGHEMAGLSQERLSLWKQGRIGESLMESRKILNENPALIHFYIFNRSSDHELGKQIREMEKNFLNKLSEVFPKMDWVTLEGLFALFFGLCWVENLSDSSVHRALSILQLGLNGYDRP